MRQNSGASKDPAEKVVKDIRHRCPYPPPAQPDTRPATIFVDEYDAGRLQLRATNTN